MPLWSRASTLYYPDEMLSTDVAPLGGPATYSIAPTASERDCECSRAPALRPYGVSTSIPMYVALFSLLMKAVQSLDKKVLVASGGVLLELGVALGAHATLDKALVPGLLLTAVCELLEQK